MTRPIGNIIAEELIKMKEEELDVEKQLLQSKLSELEEMMTRRGEQELANGPRVLPMDEEDKLRLENFMLREKLVTREISDARDALQSRFIAKYNVNILTQTIDVNTSTGKITIENKG